MKLKFTLWFCHTLWWLVDHETLIKYFEDQHIPKDLASKWKNHSKYLVGSAIEVEVPHVTEWIVTIHQKGANFVNSLKATKGMRTQDQWWCSGGKNPHCSLTKSSSALRLCMPGMLGKSSHHEKNWVSTIIFEFFKKNTPALFLSPSKNVLHSGLCFKSNT